MVFAKAQCMARARRVGTDVSRVALTLGSAAGTVDAEVNFKSIGMAIPEVARRSGIAACVLRPHERKGLLSALVHDGARRRSLPTLPGPLARIASRQAAKAGGRP